MHVQTGKPKRQHANSCALQPHEAGHCKHLEELAGWMSFCHLRMHKFIDVLHRQYHPLPCVLFMV